MDDSGRILIVDASKVSRRLIGKVVSEALPEADVVACDSGEAALAAFSEGGVDLVTTAISLPDYNGMDLAAELRGRSAQKFMPIILVSGEVNDRLQSRDINEHVTDYFDKSDGFKALGAFVRGYVKPDTSVTGHILYVEDSRVVAVATRRIMEAAGFSVEHVVSVEEALDILRGNIESLNGPAFDVVLTDVYLKGGLTGMELIQTLRGEMGLHRGKLPILVMTGDDNLEKQAALLRSGANDLVSKPIDEDLLVNKLRFQLQLSQSQDS
ncbi:MAG: response regulator [Pseudomonadota bacterium]